MIYVGTSGYSYDDWKGEFYPEDINDSNMLEFYSRHFSFTEINSTYYKMPNYFMFKSLNEKTPDEFKFSVKAYKGFTHDRNLGKDDAIKFIEALKPIKSSGKLSCIIFQFPYSFHNTSDNAEYIKRVREYFNGEEILCEFRNSNWVKIEVMEFLKEHSIGWVCVDEPDIKGLIKPIVAVTSNIGYIRFHGRNAKKWYNHEVAYERYDYMYSEKELLEWISKIKFIEKHSCETFVAFNNHFKAKGAKNASMLKRLMQN
ncbi:DUF72 domain-containing protein [Caloramator sp. E03]|uniref:DUF72 domain-containing protein n=1 Tax=Caloramator sp. E03 TaxID=2576307 RepID=UPI001110412E|nr:DUF72 domain-containing protein [Caloramator sp. E03]QCX34213.1 DUF72 domain-containing protein [Caloramator sp. E03]